MTRTSAVQGSVPAVTTVSEVGLPFVITRSGSLPVTLSTVYCHTPAHTGAFSTLTPLPAGRLLRVSRTAAMTCSPLGRPLQ
ncbi:hypothetical protein [Dactylosporangium darangshiense]|uniref:hypothetical protein n=1 Tax=Dactylosporangium darangshiense TaxID=579108 RepID=UPI00362F227D